MHRRAWPCEAGRVAARPRVGDGTVQPACCGPRSGPRGWRRVERREACGLPRRVGWDGRVPPVTSAPCCRQALCPRGLAYHSAIPGSRGSAPAREGESSQSRETARLSLQPVCQRRALAPLPHHHPPAAESVCLGVMCLSSQLRSSPSRRPSGFCVQGKSLSFLAACAHVGVFAGGAQARPLLVSMSEIAAPLTTPVEEGAAPGGRVWGAVLLSTC